MFLREIIRIYDYGYSKYFVIKIYLWLSFKLPKIHYTYIKIEKATLIPILVLHLFLQGSVFCSDSNSHGTGSFKPNKGKRMDHKKEQEEQRTTCGKACQ